MKLKPLLIGLLLAAGLTTYVWTPQATADNERKRNAAIVLGYQDMGYQVPDQWGNTSFYQTGLAVAWVDRSQHAPWITNGAPLAQSVATCLEAGMSIVSHQGGRIMLVR